MKPQVFVIDLERGELHRRIDRRLDERLAAGIVSEVQGLLDTGVAPERLLQLGLEYREAALYLAGEKSLEEMKEDLRLGIHRLAKRQQTWFRGLGRRGLPATVLPAADSAMVLEALSC